MRTFRFKINESQNKSLTIDFVPPAGTLSSRVLATNSSGSTTTLSGASSISGSTIIVNIPSSYAVYSNFPAKFEVQLQVNGGAWYTEVEAYGYLVVPDVDPNASLNATLSAKSDKVSMAGLPVFVYGNSYSILAASYFTAGKHYGQLAAAAVGGGTVTSYGVGARRIIDVISTLNNGGAYPGCSGTIAAGKWTTTTARTGIVILESCINDFGHYPTMVGTAIPAALPSANTRYRDTLKVMYRAALALMSSESRIEGSAHTATSGTWSSAGAAYQSGGEIVWTTAAGAYREYSIKPPQSGPLAGKVFLLADTLDTSVGVMAQQTISVDGTVQTTRTPSPWEQYTGHAGTVNIAPDCVVVNLPVDGAFHTVRVTHAGTAGQFMYIDSFIVPSVDPNPIAVMGAEHPLPGTPTWTAAQTAVYTANEKALTPHIKEIVAEFPNAFWVPSTMTTQGIYAADGLHPNDRGMQQRSNDLIHAMDINLKPRLKNYVLATSPNSNFPIN